MRIHLTFLLALFALACTAHAKLELPSILSDHMVLQAGKPLPVWGWAAPGVAVRVEFKGTTVSTYANAQGKWRLELAPLPADDEAAIMTIKAGDEHRVINDILVGEVWLCGGQSNMQMKLQNVEGGSEAIKQATFPEMRIFEASRRPNINPQDDVKGHWNVVSPKTIREFSAVAYFFGRDLYNALGTPVGLISSNRGGTPAQSWMPLNALQTNPELQPYVKELEDTFAMYPDLSTHWDQHYDAMIEAHKQWRQEQEKWKALPPEEKAQTPRPKWLPAFRLRKTPTIYYNSNIITLAPYAIRGVIWYQGEANGNNLQDAELYRELFPAMIASWRKLWGDDLPFYFVQLPGYAGNSGLWMSLRESQLETWQNTPNTGMVVTIDVGEADNIHPKNKLPVGQRLAYIARAQVYGEAIPYSGPRVSGLIAEGSKAHLRFDYAEDGLVAAGRELVGFEIAGPDGSYHPAQAKIDGSSVLVWSQSVSTPVSVRYAWADVPAASLLGKSGLPASPFRISSQR